MAEGCKSAKSRKDGRRRFVSVLCICGEEETYHDAHASKM
jgi:hypothetical protein